jgi:hypothetical protein
MENEELTKQKTLEELVQENLRLTQEVHAMTKRVNRYVTTQNILSVVYFILIVGPLILSLIFLPPLLSNVFSQYQNLLGPEQTAPAGDIIKSLQSGNVPKALDEANKSLQQMQK